MTLSFFGRIAERQDFQERRAQRRKSGLPEAEFVQFWLFLLVPSPSFPPFPFLSPFLPSFPPPSSLSFPLFFLPPTLGRRWFPSFGAGPTAIFSPQKASKKHHNATKINKKHLKHIQCTTLQQNASRIATKVTQKQPGMQHVTFCCVSMRFVAFRCISLHYNFEMVAFLLHFNHVITTASYYVPSSMPYNSLQALK